MYYSVYLSPPPRRLELSLTLKKYSFYCSRPQSSNGAYTHSVWHRDNDHYPQNCLPKRAGNGSMTHICMYKTIMGSIHYHILHLTAHHEHVQSVSGSNNQCFSRLVWKFKITFMFVHMPNWALYLSFFNFLKIDTEKDEIYIFINNKWIYVINLTILYN